MINTLMPILNAMGIPLLATGIILLIRAYRKSVEAYKDTSNHLREENERLRILLSEKDTSYFEQIQRMNRITAKSAEVIEELQARKVALLSKPKAETEKNLIAMLSKRKADTERALWEVKKINESIELMQKLIAMQGLFERQWRDDASHIKDEFLSLTVKIGQLAEHVGDVKSRIAIVSVVTPPEIYQKLASEVENQTRGLISTSEEEDRLLMPDGAEPIDKNIRALEENLLERKLAAEREVAQRSRRDDNDEAI